MSPKKTRAEHPKRIDVSTEDGPLGLSLGELMGHPAPPPSNPSDVPEPASPNPAATPPRFSRVVLQRTRAGRGGRWVTRVLPTPEPSPQQLETLARELRRALGTGAHLEEGVLAVQGDIADRLEDWFRRCGVPKIVR